MKRRAVELLRRGYELSGANYLYGPVIYHLRHLFATLGGTEFGDKIDRKVVMPRCGSQRP